MPSITPPGFAVLQVISRERVVVPSESSCRGDFMGRGTPRNSPNTEIGIGHKKHKKHKTRQGYRGVIISVPNRATQSIMVFWCSPLREERDPALQPSPGYGPTSPRRATRFRRFIEVRAIDLRKPSNVLESWRARLPTGRGPSGDGPSTGRWCQPEMRVSVGAELITSRLQSRSGLRAVTVDRRRLARILTVP